MDLTTEQYGLIVDALFERASTLLARAVAQDEMGLPAEADHAAARETEALAWQFWPLRYGQGGA